MKIRLLLITVASMILLPVSNTTHAQGTAFTYQGRLNDGINPANGSYDLKLQLWDAVTGGSIIGGPVTNTAVVVTNGLFTTVIEFGAGVFTGGSNWLHILVRTNGGGTFTSLTPRQQVTPTPYAIFAEGGNAAGLTGTIPSGSLSGTYGNPLNFNNAGNSFTGDGSGLTGLNASQLTTGTVPDARLSGNVALLNGTQIFTGVNSFDNNINLLDPTKTIVFPATAGPNSPMMEMFASGTVNADRMVIAHSPFYPNWGLQYQDYPDRFNFLSGGTPVLSINLGYPYAVGIGINLTNPASKLEVGGDVRIDGSKLLLEPATAGNFSNDGLWFGDGGLPGINFGGNGPFLAGYYGGALGALAPNYVCLSWNSAGDVAVSNSLTVGTSLTTTYLTVRGNYLVVNGGTPVYAYIGDDGAGSDVQIGSQRSGITALAAYNTADNAYMHFYCSSISIEGGADLAEPFQISSDEQKITQGSVVIIDEAHPGKLKLSEQPYDTRVAGVVSGANGIKPGIQMQQQGVLDGGKNVALTGRVFVLADASNGAIHPGDLLTTSSVPGHAMKVTDHSKASGAILGKAMSELKEGKGMVLVLVTLQ